jgi:hypothetical protein
VLRNAGGAKARQERWHYFAELEPDTNPESSYYGRPPVPASSSDAHLDRDDENLP